jgi:GWxTD domain-containing protein
MKKLLFVLLINLTGLIPTIQAQHVTAYLTHASFNLPGQQPYFETYLSVIGNSLKFLKQPNGKFQGAVDISVTFMQDGEIRNARKYTLNSPEVADTSKGYDNFVDQQRYMLPNGKYEMNLSIADRNKPAEKPFTANVPVIISFPDSLVSCSDIQLLESYSKATSTGVLTKSGYDLVPYVSTFYPENINTLKFYAEIYNAKKIVGADQKMIVSYQLESYESKVKLPEFGSFSRQVSNDVNIVLSELNIESLPTGNYYLIMEVRDKENKIHAEQRCFIQRQAKRSAMSLDDLNSVDVSKTFVNAYTNADTLSEYLRCLRPISAPSEISFAENQVKSKDVVLMQKFFLNFWKLRNHESPETAWKQYRTEVQKVNSQFGTYGLKGYDTDRGRVYLQYGAPDSREVSTMEPSAYPYELWQYNSLVDKAQIVANPYNRQPNKRFVFYNPDKVTNKYTLLHSDARGERNNPRWQMELYKRDTQSNNMEQKDAPNHFGNRVDDNFMNPK